MAHIHTQPGQHDHTASAYIVRIDGSEPRILLHMHKKLHTYLQFGGHVELHETPWQAVVHEVREESGYDLDQLQLLQPVFRLQSLRGSILHPYPVCHNTHKFNDEHNHTDIGWAFITSEPPRHNVADGESNALRLFTADEIRTLPDTQIFDNMRDISLFILEECLDQWQQISPLEFSLET